MGIMNYALFIMHSIKALLEKLFLCRFALLEKLFTLANSWLSITRNEITFVFAGEIATLFFCALCFHKSTVYRIAYDQKQIDSIHLPTKARSTRLGVETI